MAGCRVVWDREGQVSEIHVIATGERSAKMIARDIQSLLLVNHNLTVPHQKVSIVNLGRPADRAGRAGISQTSALAMEAGEAGTAPVAAADAEEAPRRAARPVEAATAARPATGFGWKLEGLQLRLLEGRVEVAAQLVSDEGERVQGRSAGPATREGLAVLGARAVVEAMAERWKPSRWVTIQWVDLAGPLVSQAVVVAITRTPPGRPWDARWGVGAAPVQGDTAVAGALAALEALGKLSP